MLALIIDDEIQIRRLLRLALESGNYEVRDAVNGRLGLQEAAFHRPDVVLLDLGLPDMDGSDVLKRLREWSDVPVLVLSVRDGAEDKIAALDAGADDYMQKPFDTRELLARLRAVQRRTHTGVESPDLFIGDLMVNLAGHAASVSGQPVKLTPTEFSLLATLARHAGKVVTHKHLLREVWGPQAETQGQYLRVHLTHVRRKLTDAGLQNPRIINESGIGYRLSET